MEKSAKDDDEIFEYDGFKVVISKEYSNMYSNLVIDWIDNSRGKGFTVFDKDASGCGSCSGGC
ncbi:hypothetical protein [Phosphitispora sp. TUW77]|uniref:hypothetical protein n=1 Tax=Phosphitispora sp. TUW77 TaxID=3152361 RepID=UPI003AB85AD7